jgi:hypothetical protein
LDFNPLERSEERKKKEKGGKELGRKKARRRGKLGNREEENGRKLEINVRVSVFFWGGGSRELRAR